MRKRCVSTCLSTCVSTYLSTCLSNCERVAAFLPACIPFVIAACLLTPPPRTLGADADRKPAIDGQAEAVRKLSASETEAFLRRGSEVRATGNCVRARFEETIVSAHLGHPQSTSGTLIYSAPGRFRKEVVKPSPSTSVSDGEKMWMYYPVFDQVEMYDLASKRGGLGRKLSVVWALFSPGDAASQRQFEIDVFECADGRYRLDLKAKARQASQILESATVWLDAGWRPARIEYRTPDGTRVATDLFDIEWLDAPPQGAFDFKIPEGAEVVRPFG